MVSYSSHSLKLSGGIEIARRDIEFFRHIITHFEWRSHLYATKEERARES